VNCGDLFRELVEYCYVTAASRGRASEEFTAACRRVDQDPRERQRIADMANLIDAEDAIYRHALSALRLGEQNTALPLLQQAAEAGIGEAAWLLARQLEVQGQAQESLTWYQHAAADGDPRAARRILHPPGRQAHINGYPPASDTQRPVRPHARGLLASGWMTGIVNPALAAAAVVAVVALATVATTVFPLRAAWPRQTTASATSTSTSTSTSQLAAEVAARNQAINWIMHQVNRAAMVSCDPQVCQDLASRGFPGVLTLGPMSTDPLGSELVVDTATLRAQFGSRLVSVYAPVTIASFGSGNAKIDIQLVVAGGTAKYRKVEQTALRARKTAGANLLANSQIKVSATARAQLLNGDVDPLLPLLLAGMAAIHPVQVVDFVSQSPGGGSASLLRSVDLATVDGAAHMTRAAYLGWMEAFIGAQTAQYSPGWVKQVTLPNRQAVLRVTYGAPSPLS
jgi:hypothetical protein